MTRITYNLKHKDKHTEKKSKFFDIPNGTFFTWRLADGGNEFIYLMLDVINKKCMLVDEAHAGQMIDFNALDNHIYTIIDTLEITEMHDL